MVSLPPSPNRADPPPFHRLASDAFEQMCRALLDKEEGVRLPDLFHAPRQRQFGIDIICEIIDGSGTVVVSCKCYGTIKKEQIAQWSGDFLEHWENQWKEKRVRRFILSVAAPIHSRQRRAEIAREKARFAEIDVAYEAWGPHQLQEKLRPQAGIVSQYLGPEWVALLCGRVEREVKQPIVDAAIVGQLASLQAALAAEIDVRIEAAEVFLRRGDARAMDRALDVVEADPARWSSLAADSKARLLRLRASRRLAQGDLMGAAKLADDTDELVGPEGGRRLRALIALRWDGPAAALQILGEPTASGERQLKASLLLVAGRPDQALKQLPAEGDAEDWRLRSLTLAALGQSHEALTAVRKAEVSASDWLIIRRAGIMVRYGMALSRVVAFELTAWPTPLPRNLVREDDETRRILVEAVNIAEAALTVSGLEVDDRHDLETWKLACLANLRERSPEAEAYARGLLARGSPHPGAVAWSLARGYDFDRRRVARALEDLLAAERGRMDHLVALVVLRLDSGRADRAQRDLELFGERFATGPTAEAYERWRQIAAIRATPGAPVPEDLPWERPQGLIEESERTGDWEPVAAVMRSAVERPTAYEGPAFALAAANALVAAGRWRLLAPFATLLSDQVATAEAVRLAAIAAFEAGDSKLSLEILDANTARFPHQELPLELKRLRARCLDQLGRFPEALRLTESIAFTSEELSDILAATQMRVAMGDLTGALPQFRQIAAREDLPPDQALAIADTVRLVDRHLADELWRKAQQTGVPDQLAAIEATLAYSLGRDTEAGPALAKLGAQAAREPGARVRVMDLGEISEFLRRQREHLEKVERSYLDGEAPVYILVAAAGLNLAEMYDRAFGAVGPRLLFRHGRRASPEMSAGVISQLRLQLDVTTVLASWHLDLLDILEARCAPLMVPRSLPAALLEMEDQLRWHQPRRVEAIRAIVSAVDYERIRLTRLDSQVRDLVERRHARVVDFDPQGSVELSSVSDHLVNLRRVTDALMAAGNVAEEARPQCLEALGSHAHEAPFGPQPVQGQVLVFAGSTLEVFAIAGLLEPLIEAFEVFADENWIDSSRAELSALERADRVAQSLSSLRQRIAAGIERHTYRILSAPDVKRRCGCWW
jgi:hypothetical protein